MVWLLFYFRSDLVFDSACEADDAERMCASNAASSPPGYRLERKDGAECRSSIKTGGKAEQEQVKVIEDTPFVPSVRAHNTTATWVYIAAIALIVLVMFAGW